MLLVVEGEPQKNAAGALCTMLLLQILPPSSFVDELVIVRVVVAAHTDRLLLIFGPTVQRISDLPCRRIHRRALAEALTVLETDWMLDAKRTC